MTTPQNLPTAIKLLYYTIAMFTLPLITYYSINKFFELESVKYEYGQYAIVASVSWSVIVVNMIIGSYVYSAFQEEDDNSKSDIGRESQYPSVGVFKKNVIKKRLKERSD